MHLLRAGSDMHFREDSSLLPGRNSRKYYFLTPPFAVFSSKFDLVFCNVHTEEENVSPPNVDVKIIQFARGLFCLGTRS